MCFARRVVAGRDQTPCYACRAEDGALSDAGSIPATSTTNKKGRLARPFLLVVEVGDLKRTPWFDWGGRMPERTSAQPMAPKGRAPWMAPVFPPRKPSSAEGDIIQARPR